MQNCSQQHTYKLNGDNYNSESDVHALCRNHTQDYIQPPMKEVADKTNTPINVIAPMRGHTLLNGRSKGRVRASEESKQLLKKAAWYYQLQI